MSNTPGQDSPPPPPSPPPPSRAIDAKALQDQLIEFMLETALRQKRFQSLIGLMEQVTAEARAKKGDDWKAAFEQLRKDIAASQARGPATASSAPGPELAEIKVKLSRLEAQMTVLLKALSGAEIHPTAAGPATAGPRPSAITANSTPNSAPNSAPSSEGSAGSGAISSPGSSFRKSAAKDERRSFFTGWTPILSIVCLLVAAAALATLVMSERLEEPSPPLSATPQACTPDGTSAACAPGSAAHDPPTTPAANATTSAATSATAVQDPSVPGADPTPVAQAPAAHAPSAWEIAWSQALVQPAICPNDPKRLRAPLARCVCGEPGQAAALSADGGAGIPVKGLEAQCPLDEKDAKWNNRLALAALQAVLMSAKRLEGKAPGRADGDLGDHTISAVKVLSSCPSLAQGQARALAALQSKASGADERGTAALKLLAALKADPSCLNAESAAAAGGAAPPAARPSPRRP